MSLSVLRAVIPALAMTFLLGCVSIAGTTSEPIAVEMCPPWVEPILWHDNDTLETKRYIWDFLTKYDSFCGAPDPDPVLNGAIPTE